jgi:hypothetical protein
MTGRAAERNAAGGRHRAAGGLPRRTTAGAAQARARLDHQGAHRAPGPVGPGWVTDPQTLRRVRDALAAGRRP